MSEIIWDLALIQKYNQSGPRYTSYPTALEFNESYTNEDFIAAANRYPERPLSLYVHIPFCHKLCYFCGCNKVITRHQHKADIYLDYLEKEIKETEKSLASMLSELTGSERDMEGINELIKLLGGIDE